MSSTKLSLCYNGLYVCLNCLLPNKRLDILYVTHKIIEVNIIKFIGYVSNKFITLSIIFINQYLQKLRSVGVLVVMSDESNSI